MKSISSDVAENRERALKTWARTYASALRGSGGDLDHELGVCANRPDSDLAAAWARWHDPSGFLRLNAVEKSWFRVFEQARVESIAAEHLPGIETNLSREPIRGDERQLQEILFYFARCCFLKRKEFSLARFFIEHAWRGAIKQEAGWLKSLLWARSEIAASADFAELAEKSLLMARNYLFQPEMFLEKLEPLIRQVSKCQSSGAPVSGFINFTSKPMIDLDLEQVSKKKKKSANFGKSTKVEAGKPVTVSKYQKYKIYTTILDEEKDARTWVRPQDKALLTELSSPNREKIMRLARDFQLRIRSRLLRHWNFDLEHGQLDSRRLARLLTAPCAQDVFREERNILNPNVCVSLLVDQSGSMRGERQRISAMAIDIAAHSLETLNIPCEVLGFTSRYRGSNAISKQWHASHAKEIPGRLNAVRHIIFKSFEEPWWAKRSNLGLLLRRDFGKENFDGEALHWAADRLGKKPMQKKILMVFSDGTPFDSETVIANGRGFLEDHLREVIKNIEQSKVSLVAVGRGSEIKRFYQNVVEVSDDNAIGKKIFQALEEALIIRK